MIGQRLLLTRYLPVVSDYQSQSNRPTPGNPKTYHYLHNCSGCFWLEQLPGEIYFHWESAALPRRTPGPVVDVSLL